MLKIGDPAPDFNLLNQDGEAITLSQFRGKTVILFAFPRADTPACTKQACHFRDNLPKLKAKNTVVLGISTDKPKDLLKWQQKESISYDLLSDPDHAVLDQWGAWGERSMYGRKYMGIVRSHWLIDEQGIVRDIQIKVTPENSIKLALKALK